METTGNVREIQRNIKYEWEIKDFLLLGDQNKHKKCRSPKFSFYGVSWEIWIYPYGKRKGSAEYIGLFLASVSLPKPVTMDFSLGFKAVEGKTDRKGTDTQLFKGRSVWGWHQFISRSDLIERKAELLPSGTLTVICTLTDTTSNITGILGLQQDFRKISLNEDLSDVILKVGVQEFKSHRFILAARSPVFSAMMKNKMKESVTGVVEISDVDPETFSDFLEYLYTGSTEYLTPENVAKLYTVADKYQVDVLKGNCLDYMLMNVSIENFCDVFYLSVQHDQEELKGTCIQYFVKHSLDIIKTCKWQSFLSENPIICNELLIKFLELNKDK